MKKLEIENTLMEVINPSIRFKESLSYMCKTLCNKCNTYTNTKITVPMPLGLLDFDVKCSNCNNVTSYEIDVYPNGYR